MGKYMNDLKAHAKTFQVDRMIRAFGKEKALELLADIDRLAPRLCGSRSIDKSPLSPSEMTAFNKALSAEAWKDVGIILDNKRNPVPAFGRLAVRYIYNHLKICQKKK